MTYDGRDLYDFDAALARARTVDRNEEPQAVRDDRRFWLAEFPEPPTAEAVRRHIQRFGDEGVDEIVTAYRLDLSEHGRHLDEIVSAVKSRTSKRSPKRRMVRRPKAGRFS
jgi:hypothetical protein